jgi:hypothetical protein
MISQIVDPPETCASGTGAAEGAELARGQRATKKALWGAVDGRDASFAGAQQMLSVWGHPERRRAAAFPEASREMAELDARGAQPGGQA